MYVYCYQNYIKLQVTNTTLQYQDIINEELTNIGKILANVSNLKCFLTVYMPH